jgi:hypothetical protein
MSLPMSRGMAAAGVYISTIIEITLDGERRVDYFDGCRNELREVDMTGQSI